MATPVTSFSTQFDLTAPSMSAPRFAQEHLLGSHRKSSIISDNSRDLQKQHIHVSPSPTTAIKKGEISASYMAFIENKKIERLYIYKSHIVVDFDNTYTKNHFYFLVHQVLDKQ